MANVVVEAVGAAIADSTLKGYLPEGARAQILATANIRDMTTAGWTLGATMTRARTSVGADGAANSATRLTGGAVAATNTCYTTITAAASSRTYSALVKRVTGTGPVRIVQTGTETDISSLINSSTYTLVELNASVLNVAVGFKIDTNLDAIDVDFNQFEAGAFASSRMASVGAREADVLTYPTSGNVSGTAGTCYAEVCGANQTSSNEFFVEIGAVRMALYYDPSGGQFMSIYDGTTAAKDSVFVPSSIPQKVASSWGGSSMRTAVGGALGSGAAFDGDMNVGAQITIGNDFATAGSSPFGNIRNVRIWIKALPKYVLKTLTGGTGPSSSDLLVSAWEDASGNDRPLEQITVASQPAYNSATGEVTFDGVDDFLKTAAFTLNQPETVYIVFKQVTWTDTDRVFDGNASASGAVYQSATTPKLRATAGSVLDENAGLAVGAYGIVTAVFNGASSLTQVNAGTAVTGDAGAANMSGFTLASAGTAGTYGNVIVKEVIIFSAAHTAAQRTAVQNALFAKHLIHPV